MTLTEATSTESTNLTISQFTETLVVSKGASEGEAEVGKETLDLEETTKVQPEEASDTLIDSKIEIQ